MVAKLSTLAPGGAMRLLSPIVRTNRFACTRSTVSISVPAFHIATWMIGPNHSASSSSIRSEEHTSELQSLMRISYAVFCLKKKKLKQTNIYNKITNHNNKRHIYKETI